MNRLMNEHRGGSRFWLAAQKEAEVVQAWSTVWEHEKVSSLVCHSFLFKTLAG